MYKIYAKDRRVGNRRRLSCLPYSGCLCPDVHCRDQVRAKRFCLSGCAICSDDRLCVVPVAKPDSRGLARPCIRIADAPVAVLRERKIDDAALVRAIGARRHPESPDSSVMTRLIRPLEITLPPGRTATSHALQPSSCRPIYAGAVNPFRWPRSSAPDRFPASTASSAHPATPNYPSRVWVRLHDDRHSDQVGQAASLQLLDNVRAMQFDRAEADAEMTRYDLVRLARSHEVEHLALAFCQ